MPTDSLHSSSPRAARPALPQVHAGTRAAVACGHPDAARAALQVIEAGGNVVDAAVAASAVMAVAMPHATSLGGDAFFLVREAATGRVHGLNASGTAPLRAAADAFPQGMAQRGAAAPVVPGLAMGWHALHRRFGTADWAGLLAPAAALAAKGCEVSAALAQSIAAAAPELMQDPGSAALFLPAGRLLQAGETLRQGALAASLRALADHGPGALYRGDLGRELVRTLQERGGPMDVDDLAAFTASWVEPLCARYGGHEVHTMPPNSYGVLMLMQLRALEALPRRALCGADLDRMLWQIRAMRAAFDDALAEIGDPLHMRLTAADLLAEGRIAGVRERMLGDLPEPGPVPTGGTACATLADAAGNAVCIVQSIFNPFGAHLLDPRTGFMMNNRMYGFDHRPGHVNTVAGRKRSAHTLNPVLVTRQGELRLAYASPGGVSQTITGTQVLVNLIDREMDLAAAVGATRWATDRQGGILVEPQAGAALLEPMRAAGLPARQEENAYLFGSVTAVQRGIDGTLSAVGDLRRQAAALAC